MHPLLPAKDKFPYTLRVVSEITETNGSSSMATVCGSSLALMDAGVPLARPVAGIAMGLIKEDRGFAVLSDILGDEDHLGDMDFKVAGTESGVTALQMDIKITSITPEIMQVALDQAREGRLHILGEMAKALTGARGDVAATRRASPSINIPKDKIREVIGTGGKVIREIVEQTGAKIDIEDDGTIKVAANEATKAQAAIDWIRGIVAEPEIGVIYTGKVVKTVDFGAFVNFLGSRDGLVHISELAPGPRRQDHRRRQGRRRGEGQGARLRRSRQGEAVDEARSTRRPARTSPTRSGRRAARRENGGPRRRTPPNEEKLTRPRAR